MNLYLGRFDSEGVGKLDPGTLTELQARDISNESISFEPGPGSKDFFKGYGGEQIAYWLRWEDGLLLKGRAFATMRGRHITLKVTPVEAYAPPTGLAKEIQEDFLSGASF